jgi:hypothetical protein
MGEQLERSSTQEPDEVTAKDVPAAVVRFRALKKAFLKKKRLTTTVNGMGYLPWEAYSSTLHRRRGKGQREA